MSSETLSGSGMLAVDEPRMSVGEEDAKCIIEVAYLLASADGVVRDEEIAEFRSTVKMLLGDRFADSEVVLFLGELSDKSRRLIDLKRFYATDDEFVSAFTAVAQQAVARLTKDPRVVRHAFAFWMGMCCSDNEFAAIERKTLHALQNMCNERLGGAASAVTDAFLGELERRVLEINCLEAQLCDKTKATASSELQGQIVSFQEFLG